jgi:hypothetical protein
MSCTSNPHWYGVDSRAPEPKSPSTAPRPPQTAPNRPNPQSAGLRGVNGLFLFEVHRADGEVLRAVGPDTVLEAGDTLYFAGGFGLGSPGFYLGACGGGEPRLLGGEPRRPAALGPALFPGLAAPGGLSACFDPRLLDRIQTQATWRLSPSS